MGSSWVGRSGNTGSVYFAPAALIIPVYHKIRINFDTILRWVLKYDEALKKAAPPQLLDELSQLEWDVLLTTGSELKSEFRGNPCLSAERRWELLSRPMPRFIWRALGRIDGSPRFDMLFDATDIDHSRSLLFEKVKYLPV
jgi:hypothetical protein